ncbi:hypothetical protein GGI43DRAFT_410758 [Trichoderma evansii]
MFSMLIILTICPNAQHRCWCRVLSISLQIFMFEDICTILQRKICYHIAIWVISYIGGPFRCLLLSIFGQRTPKRCNCNCGCSLIVSQTMPSVSRKIESSKLKLYANLQYYGCGGVYKYGDAGKADYRRDTQQLVCKYNNH